MASQNPFAEELTALSSVLAALGGLEEDQRTFVLRTAAARLGITGATLDSDDGQKPGAKNHSASNGEGSRSAGEVPTPKKFLQAKKPRTDVERIACLAYYMAHYREQAHFKTLDLTKLNTEAAQPRFSNAAKTVNNATVQNGFLAPAGKGSKQISALGEQFVTALPDREAADAAIEDFKQRRRRRTPKNSAKKKGSRA